MGVIAQFDMLLCITCIMNNNSQANRVTFYFGLPIVFFEGSCVNDVGGTFNVLSKYMYQYLTNVGLATCKGIKLRRGQTRSA